MLLRCSLIVINKTATKDIVVKLRGEYCLTKSIYLDGSPSEGLDHCCPVSGYICLGRFLQAVSQLAMGGSLP